MRIFNSIVDVLKRFSPQILTLIFLGYAPFFGESFRLYFKNPSGFILLAIILALMYWRQFKNFIFEKNATQFWWLLITLYCVLITLPHFGQYSAYYIYLDLGIFCTLFFGIFFGKKIASKLTLKELVVVMTIILVLFSGKIIWMWLNQTPALNEGYGFFIGFASYSSLPKIILRGQNPFLIAMFILVTGILLLRKNNALEIIGLTLIFLLTMGMIVISGVRSIYFGIIPSCIFLVLQVPKVYFKKVAYVTILLGTFFFTLHLFIGRDKIPTNPADSFIVYHGMDILADNGWGFLNGDLIDRMASNYIPALNSRSVALKMAEYLEVIACVNDNWLSGLGSGALCFSPATQNFGNYVHSQPLWLYLKGGLILVILFYSLIIYTIFKIIQLFRDHPEEIGLRIGSAIIIALCILDILTNQFPTLAGSFYLGFWIGCNPKKPEVCFSRRPRVST
ncbi:hypothetical protein [Polynucleobacter alcilacus]|uniref:hypothetical protein n=1 Tax=Polynucleobacter alcilacus TaxID=1819739 RepID=UPI001C0E05C4|nr:hypothetical protein [Polynucleobacter alcilacus]MBU3568165.1 hypothetical protein [Polynucleobacter alcilacus]